MNNAYMIMYVRENPEAFSVVLEVIKLFYDIMFYFISPILFIAILLLAISYALIFSRDVKARLKTIVIRAIVLFFLTLTVKVEVAQKPTLEIKKSADYDPKIYSSDLRIPVIFAALISLSQYLQNNVENLLYTYKNYYFSSDLSFPEALISLNRVLSANFANSLDLQTAMLFQEFFQKVIFPNLTHEDFEDLMDLQYGGGSTYEVIDQLVKKIIKSGENGDRNIPTVLSYLAWRRGEVKFFTESKDDAWFSLEDAYKDLKERISNCIIERIDAEVGKSTSGFFRELKEKNVNYMETGKTTDLIFGAFFANSFSGLLTTEENAEKKILFNTAFMTKKKSSELEYKFMVFFAERLADIYLLLTLLLYPFIFPLIIFVKTLPIFFRYVTSFIAYSAWVLATKVIDTIIFIFSRTDILNAFNVIAFARNSSDLENMISSMNIYPVLITIMYPTLLGLTMWLFNGSFAHSLVGGRIEAPQGNEYAEASVKGNFSFDQVQLGNFSALGTNIGGYSRDNVSVGTQGIGGMTLQDLKKVLDFDAKKGSSKARNILNELQQGGYIDKKSREIDWTKLESNTDLMNDLAEYARETSANIRIPDIARQMGRIEGAGGTKEAAELEYKDGQLEAQKKQISTSEAGEYKAIAEEFVRTVFPGISSSSGSEDTKKAEAGGGRIFTGQVSTAESKSVTQDQLVGMTVDFVSKFKGEGKFKADHLKEYFDELDNHFDKGIYGEGKNTDNVNFENVAKILNSSQDEEKKRDALQKEGFSVGMASALARLNANSVNK